MTNATPSRPLFLSAGLSGKTPLTDPEFAANVVALAEAAGIDLLLLGETAPGEPTPAFDPLVTASWLAPRAGGVGLVAYVPALEAEPFHVARALSALDFMHAGRSGWMPGLGGRGVPRVGAGAAIPPEQEIPKARDFVAAACSLWDSWDADALIIDTASGIYLDPDKVRPCNYEGAFFKIRGPLNAMRPPQGHPLLVQTDRDPLWRELATDVLITDGDAPPGRADQRRSLRFAPARWNAAGLDDAQRRCDSSAIEGLHLVLGDAAAELPRFASEILPELRRRGLWAPTDRSATLRARLGLPTPGARR